MSPLSMLTPEKRDTLRRNLHKVAAIVARENGLPCLANEITVKEASHLLGVQFFQNYLEKKAMLEGIVNVMHLLRDRG